MPIVSINPANGETIEQYEEMSTEQVDAIIDQCHQAFLDWRDVPFAERARLMHAAAQILRDGQEDYARLMTAEMGKPIKQGRAEAEKCGWVCDYYADNAETFLASQAVKTDASKSFVAFEPIGAVLAVMPGTFLSGKSCALPPRP